MPSLQEDLLQSFQEQKQWMQNQIDEFQPLAETLRKPALSRIAGKGLILLGELICWLLFLAALVACIFLNRIYPFSLLFQDTTAALLHLPIAKDLQVLRLCSYGLLALCSLSFLLLARSLAGIRKRNSILSLAGSRIKTLVGQHLARKAAIDVLEQRHFGSSSILTKQPDPNEVPNPGMDSEA